MTFAKCLASDVDLFASCAAATREIPAGRATMRHMLHWNRAPHSPAHRSNSPSPQCRSRTQSAKDDPSSGGGHSNNNSEDEGGDLRSASASSLASEDRPAVTYRKGEKSFLDFHQRYAITRHLGEGSYSTVKQVTLRKQGGVFACKIVDKLSLSPVDRQALSHEVRVLASVRHPHIMRLHEVIEDDAKCYLVTELAESGDLFDRIVKQGRFPEREAQKVTAALVEALAYCHGRGIIHRDVKPENVLLSGETVKLCDFGFAKQLEHPDEQSSDSCGTPGYAAPEILDGRSYGLEVDVFSLGVVTYIMLCGYPPFPMKLAQLRTHRFHVRFPSKDWGGIHSDVKELIASMLSVNPQARPSTQALRAHAWVRAGKAALDQSLREAAERRRLAALTRKQQSADAIRKKLAMGGFDVIKYGRNGMPHRTKLRLSADGKTLSWQPKLLKRSLLRYQNGARSFTSLLGLTRDHAGNSTSQPQLHANVDDRLSTTADLEREAEAERSDRKSSAAEDRTSEGESSLQSSGSSATVTVATASRTSSHGSCSSTSSTDTIGEKRLWWRSLRRERGHTTERTASGGFTLPFAARLSSAVASPNQPSPPPSPSSAASSKTPALDDSIHVMDVRAMLLGDAAPFFTGHTSNEPNSCKRAVDLACVLSVATRGRELHLEFANGDLRNGFAYLLEQIALPLQQPAGTKSSRPESDMQNVKTVTRAMSNNQVESRTAAVTG